MRGLRARLQAHDSDDELLDALARAGGAGAGAGAGGAAEGEVLRGEAVLERLLKVWTRQLPRHAHAHTRLLTRARARVRAGGPGEPEP